MKRKKTLKPQFSSYIDVDCDPQKISQVVFNLLDNAMKFTSEGKIIVSTSINTHPHGNGVSTSINTHPHGNGVSETAKRIGIKDDSLKTFDGKKHKKYKNEIVVSVQDTGVGINPGIRDQLFEKFATKSKQGTGLGLYLSKKMLRPMVERFGLRNQKHITMAIELLGEKMEPHSNSGCSSQVQQKAHKTIKGNAGFNSISHRRGLEGVKLYK